MASIEGPPVMVNACTDKVGIRAICHHCRLVSVPEDQHPHIQHEKATSWRLKQTWHADMASLFDQTITSAVMSAFTSTLLPAIEAAQFANHEGVSVTSLKLESLLDSVSQQWLEGCLQDMLYGYEVPMPLVHSPDT